LEHHLNLNEVTPDTSTHEVIQKCLRIVKGVTEGQIYSRGVFLKTNYQRGSLFKVFAKGVCSCMDAARRNGEKRVPPSAVARKVLTWLGAANTKGDTSHAS